MQGTQIGFFDSGIGGLTVLEAVHHLLPEYDTVYLGDTARAPYGGRTHDELVAFTWQACVWLFAQGCELVIVACNTASASALREIQQTRLQSYPDKRILGVIRPTVEELTRLGYQNILVLSTEATKKSGAYVHEFKKLNPNIAVESHACPRWAPMIEAGKAGSAEMREEVTRELKLATSKSPKVDAVLLACTHYPYVKTDVAAQFNGTPIFEQGELVARSLRTYLQRHQDIDSQLSKKTGRAYFVTGQRKRAKQIAQDFFGYAVDFKQVRLT